MIYQKFFISRVSETSADTLLAIGWAAVLQRVLRTLNKPARGIMIRNPGSIFEVELPVPLDADELASEARLTFLVPLITATQREHQAKKGRSLRDGFLYEEQGERQRNLSESLKSLPVQLRRPEARLQKDPQLATVLKTGARTELTHYRAINMLKVPDTFNEIVGSWEDLAVDQQWLAIRLLCQLFSQPVNDSKAAQQAWAAFAKAQHITSPTTVTAVQVVNPTTGKGANSNKSNRLAVGGMESFWLLEMLKFQGFMLGAAPYVLKGSKDRKTYVILPETIEIDTLATLMRQFNEICWSNTAIKQDILAALRLAQILLAHRRAVLSSFQRRKAWRNGSSANAVSVVQGFDVTSYKDMGSAHTTINLATINVPNWFPETTQLDDLEEHEQLLLEHIQVIRRIEGHQGKEGSDELKLLYAYRDFLSGHDLQPFWRFAALYGIYVFRQREREKNDKLWLPQLTMKGLDQLIMHANHANKSESIIMQTPGFQHIASAIREATVRAQRRVSQENDDRYEIRYGLNQDLLQKVRLREDFMIALGKFVSIYNTETAREEEKLAKKLAREGSVKRLTAQDYHKYHLRSRVTTTDLEQFGELLNTYSTELVATLLLAYGSSRVEMLKKEEIEAPEEQDSNDVDASEETE